MITKPMLAAKVPMEKLGDLHYPLIASPKLDGIRCLGLKGKVLSRKFKPIRNDYIRLALEVILPDGADGEIMAGDAFCEVSSAVMSKEGMPKFCYWMFDYVLNNDITVPYAKRLINMIAWWDGLSAMAQSFITLVPTKIIYNLEELLKFESKCLEEGYEGVITRLPTGPYKCGRSTLKEEYLLKVKRFVDDEAAIIDFEEMMHNNNILQKDELGYAKRSSAKDGKTGADTLGKFVVKHKNGLIFKIGTGKGLTHKLRKEIWDNRDKYLGKIVKYKYQPIGVKEAPRIPIWLGFRDPTDI